MLRHGRLVPVAALAAAGVLLSSATGARAGGPPTLSRSVAQSIVGKYRITIHLRHAHHVDTHGGRIRRQVFELGDRCTGDRCEVAWLLGDKALGLIARAHGRFHTTLRDRDRCIGTHKPTIDAFHVRFTVRGRRIAGRQSLVNTDCGVRASELVTFAGRRIAR